MRKCNPLPHHSQIKIAFDFFFICKMFFSRLILCFRNIPAFSHLGMIFFTVAQLWHDKNLLNCDSCGQSVPQLSPEPGTPSHGPSAPQGTASQPELPPATAPKFKVSSIQGTTWTAGRAPPEQVVVLAAVSWKVIAPTSWAMQDHREVSHTLHLTRRLRKKNNKGSRISVL